MFPTSAILIDDISASISSESFGNTMGKYIEIMIYKLNKNLGGFFK